MKKLKLTALLVTMAMTASLAGCGNSASEETTDSTQLSQATATQEAAGTETAENMTEQNRQDRLLRPNRM